MIKLEDSVSPAHSFRESVLAAENNLIRTQCRHFPKEIDMSKKTEPQPDKSGPAEFHIEEPGKRDPPSHYALKWIHCEMLAATERANAVNIEVGPGWNRAPKASRRS